MEKTTENEIDTGIVGSSLSTNISMAMEVLGSRLVCFGFGIEASGFR